MNFYKENKKSIDKILFIITFLLTVYVLVKYLLGLFAPFILAYIISFVITPILNFFNKKLKIPRGLATALSIVVFVGSIGLIGLWIMSIVIKEGMDFFNNIPNLIEYFNNTIYNLELKLNNLEGIIPESLSNTINNLKVQMVKFIVDIAASFLKSFSTKFVYSFPKFIIICVVGLISSFFYTKDKYLINNTLKKLVPSYGEKKLKLLYKSGVSAILNYFKAEFLMMCIIGSVCITGLTILGVQYSFFIGFLIGIIDAIPALGSGFFYWPWVTFSLITGNYNRSIGLLCIYFIIFFIRQGLEPRIVGDQLGVHPVVMLMSVYFGLYIFGIPGVIIGPCVSVIIKSIIDV